MRPGRDVSRGVRTAVGHWMAEQLGMRNRRKHFVLLTQPIEECPDGLRRYRSDCGELCIPADREYLDRMPFCALCKAKHEHSRVCC